MVRVRQHRRKGTKGVSSHNRSKPSRKGTSGVKAHTREVAVSTGSSKNMVKKNSPKRLYFSGDKVIIVDTPEPEIYKVLGVDRKTFGIIDYKLQRIDSQGLASYPVVEQKRLAKVKKDDEGYFAVTDNLIHYFDEDELYERSKLR